MAGISRVAVRPLPRSIRHNGVYRPHGKDNGVQWLTGIGAYAYRGEEVPDGCVVVMVTDDPTDRVLPADEVDDRTILGQFLILQTDLLSVLTGALLLKN